MELERKLLYLFVNEKLKIKVIRELQKMKTTVRLLHKFYQ